MQVISQPMSMVSFQRYYRMEIQSPNLRIRFLKFCWHFVGKEVLYGLSVQLLWPDYTLKHNSSVESGFFCSFCLPSSMFLCIVRIEFVLYEKCQLFHAYSYFKEEVCLVPKPIILPKVGNIRPVVADVFCGIYSTYVVSNTGDVFGFGLNNYYQLGNT